MILSCLLKALLLGNILQVDAWCLIALQLSGLPCPCYAISVSFSLMCFLFDHFKQFAFFPHSAILYLNDEFEGGDFFYAHSTTDLSPEVDIGLV